MATHSSVLAWRIPGIGKPGGLPSLGSHRVGHNWSNLAAAAANKKWVKQWMHTTWSSLRICVSCSLNIWRVQSSEHSLWRPLTNMRPHDSTRLRALLICCRYVYFSSREKRVLFRIKIYFMNAYLMWRGHRHIKRNNLRSKKAQNVILSILGL